MRDSVSQERTRRRRRWTSGGGLIATAALLVTGSVTAASYAAPEPPQIKVLSNRADLISGGDALVEVELPDRADPAQVTVRLNGRDISDELALRSNGRFMGLITGLREGENELTAHTSPSNGARLTITNHGLAGPVFSGPRWSHGSVRPRLPTWAPPLTEAVTRPRK